VSFVFVFLNAITIDKIFLLVEKTGEPGENHRPVASH
jgi:hypothetical protein